MNRLKKYVIIIIQKTKQPGLSIFVIDVCNVEVKDNRIYSNMISSQRKGLY